MMMRLAAVAALLVGVVAVHGCVVQQVSRHMGRLGLADAGPERLTAIYTRTMAPAEPVKAAAVAPSLPPKPKRRVTSPVSDVAASEPVVPEPPAEPMPELAPEVADVGASAPAVVAASEPSESPPFEWPDATRITYDLTGNYRGPIHGDAQVEWVRVGDIYQVHLDVSVGPSLAPFMSRRMSSSGRITPDGLRPERYDQQTKMPFSTPTHAVVLLEHDHVQLANGQRRERWPGVQDTASQFVQLAWRFSTQPDQLVPGGTVIVPLAMPRAIQEMVYDVSEREMLATPFGDVPVYRLVPRLVPRAGGDLSVEMWIAPEYRYLPIRLKIHQDAETFVDLMITKPPELPQQG